MADTKRERFSRALENFEADFGKLGDRMEQAAHPELDRVDLPKAERDGIATREPAKEQDNRAIGADEYKFRPDKEVKPTFERSAKNEAQPDRESGRGSQMVEKGSTQLNNRPPPEIAKTPDTQRHNTEVSKDDRAAKADSRKRAYYAQARERGVFKKQPGLNNDRDNNRDQDRPNDPDRDRGFER